MPKPAATWILIFSDGTGQRGVPDEEVGEGVGGMVVKNTNVFQMYAAADAKQEFDAFYDPGLGAPEDGDNAWSRTARNFWSKATGWGITANIADCYEALIIKWRPGMKIGFFGFSRGAYTVRCLGGVLSTCGIATQDDGSPISKEEKGPGADRRRKLAEDAVRHYKLRDARKRKSEGAAFVARHEAARVMPDVIGVFDTVKSLGLPGITDLVDVFRHKFHDQELSFRVEVGLHALSIDENRKAFAPVLWDNPKPESAAAGQIIEQCWFPGVHSDVGGGYDDDNSLGNVSLRWMLDRLKQHARLTIPIAVDDGQALLGKAHDERTGLGVFWLQAQRSVQAKSVDVDALCPDIEKRFETYLPPYRPKPLSQHPRVERFFSPG